MGIVQNKVTPEFFKWVGYCEKDKRSQLGTYDNPENYTKNAGDGNYTVFADLYKSKTGINVQGQPWCDSFVDTVLIHLFGVDNVRKMIGGFSAYTPTSANYYKQLGRWYSTPKEGDQIFFHNGTRIYHTGYVYKVGNGYVYTVEGNTSTTAVLENEGGCVAKKSYPLGWKSGSKYIAGYGRPDYSLVEEYVEGWIRAADGVRWWYQRANGSYPSNKWCIINKHYYLFDNNGYMLTGWHKWNGSNVDTEDGEWYYLDDTENGGLEGACWHETNNRYGALECWELDMPNDI